MKFFVLHLAFLFTLTAFSQTRSEIPPFMGDWQGMFDDQKGDADLVARVIGLGNSNYRIQILPEWDKRAVPYVDVEATEIDGRIKFKQGEWEVSISSNSFEGIKYEKQDERAFRLKHIQRKSPSLGLTPPDDAIVLFNGTDFNEWIHPDSPDEKIVWKIEDGAMEILPGMNKIDGKRSKNDLITKRQFTDLELHIEFCIPYQPEKREQGRSNSGVFLQNFYEIQILDSYGLDGMWNDCGALYKMSPPKVNMCFPPGEWQTYDIVYYSPVFDNSGTRIKNAIITVNHNGVLIHNRTELVQPTAHNQSARKTDKAPFDPAPIMLQDHSNPVKFRNIWIREIVK
ncbi:MAG: DUF1080 domain-containing protein [Bacteroidales bacterium]|nr:DUF1080 domain-containing protein [Bacteroidales bacterium]MCF8389334.1 DUF1080 domain-containing protein [Bacteroidales bacterium]